MTERYPQPSLLNTLLHPDRTALLDTLQRRTVAPHTIIVNEGEPGDRAYLILDGEIEVIKALGTPDERQLDLCLAGEFIGEMSLLNPGQPRTASLRARTAASLAELTPDDFEALLQRHPGLAHRVARELSERLRDSDNATIRDLQIKNQALRQAYQELQAAQAQLVEKEKLEHELTMARQIQESLLPRHLPTPPGYDFGARVLPARFIGGDFYDVFPLGRDKMGVVVGDVCGKGVPSALVMAMTRSLLRPAATRGRSPHTVLKVVNAHLLAMNDSGLFVTVLYGVLTLATGEFVYVRAAHETPIVLDADGVVLPTERGLGQPLGIMDEPELVEQTLVIPAGGVMLLHSDGAPDALDPDGVAFGLERLRSHTCRHHTLPAQALCDQLLAVLTAYQGSAPQHDDITLVAVHAQPSS